jgi:alkylhydroperoxidase/carboxymuconolactone decarboxylase family protein YurZ
MLDEDMFQRGAELMGRVLGADTAQGARERHEAAKATGNAERNDYSTQVAWGFMLHRPQLALRDRAIVMLTSDVVQGTPLAMRDHVRLALYAGVTREEINEILFQLSQYCGFPRTREAGVIIRELFADLDAGRPIDRKSK